ncbi:MAG TPA: hypothetical protein VE978_22805 [Chitinophagales bacterium]|nr:hypothetical protein [Chitinophagales bacterium]
MKDPAYSSMRVVLLIIIVAVIAFFIYMTAHQNSLQGTARIINKAIVLKNIDGIILNSTLRSCNAGMYWQINPDTGEFVNGGICTEVDEGCNAVGPVGTTQINADGSMDCLFQSALPFHSAGNSRSDKLEVLGGTKTDTSEGTSIDTSKTGN